METHGETELDSGKEPKHPPTVETRNRVFGPFEILGELGQGGMGIVYRARRAKPARDVALKMIHAGRFAGERFRQRFELEADAIGSLEHPNVVALFEAGEIDEQFYYTMPLVEGPPLSRVIDEQKWCLRDCVALMKKLAEAMAHVHQRGILHRDLKPSNILLKENGEPVISDFGLAKVVGDSSSDLTMPGAVMGSPAFMAPEQAGGRTEDISTATDVYGLGIILYSLVCGSSPFGGESAAKVLNKVLYTNPPSPVGAYERIDRDLRTIMLKCLEKNPRDRYSTAVELADELDRWLNYEPIQARPVGMASRVMKWARRSPMQAVLSAVLLMVLLVAASVITVQRAQYFHRLVDAEMDHAERAVEDGEIGHAMARWAEILRLDPDNVIVSERIRETLMNRRFAKLIGRPFPLPEGSKHVGFSTSGAFALSRVENEKAKIWDVRNGEMIAELEMGRFLKDYEFDVNGSFLVTATSRTNGVVVWDVELGERILELPSGSVNGSVAIDRGGSVIGTFTHLEKVRLWDRTGNMLSEFQFGMSIKEAQRGVAFDPLGEKLAAYCGDRLLVWNLADGEIVVTNRGRIYLGTEIDDKSELMAAWNWNQVELWSLSTGKLIKNLELERRVTDGAFVPGRNRLAVASGKMVRLWDLQGNVVSKEKHATSVTHLLMAEEGGWFVTGTAGGVVRIWSSTDGRPLSEPIVHGDAIAALEIESGDQSIAVATQDGWIHRWDLRDDRPMFQTDGPATSVDISPEGAEVLVASRLNGRSCGVLFDRKSNGIVHKFFQSERIRRAMFGSSGRQVLTWGGRVGRLWSRGTQTWDESPISLKCDNVIRCGGFNDDGSMVVLGDIGIDFKGGATVWRGLPNGSAGSRSRDDTRKPDHHFAHEYWVYAVHISPDGRFLASGTGRGHVSVWNLATEKQQHRFRLAGTISWIEFSRDNRSLVAASNDGSARVWDLVSGKPIKNALEHGDDVNCARFSPVDSTIVTASDDETARLWNAETGKPFGAKMRHEAEVKFVAFSPDGTRVATASNDGTARVWDARTGEPVTSPLLHSAAVTHLDFGPDGKWLAAVSEDGNARMWKVVNQEPGSAKDLIQLAERTGGYAVRNGVVVKVREWREEASATH